jgi:hypothetical protein
MTHSRARTALATLLLLAGAATVTGLGSALADTTSVASSTVAPVTTSPEVGGAASHAPTTTVGPLQATTTATAAAPAETTGGQAAAAPTSSGAAPPTSATTTVPPGASGDPPDPTTTTTPATSSTAAPAPAARGLLSISAPGPKALVAANGVRVLSAHLGPVTVTDSRGVTDGAWTASVTATRFTAAGAPGGGRLPASAIAYWSGPVLAHTGVAVLHPAQPSAARSVVLTTTRTAVAATAVAGANTATWNPTIVVRIPPGTAPGSYSGALVHSVA